MKTRIMVDQENSAETWWSALYAAGSRPRLADRLAGGAWSVTTRKPAEVAELRTWCESLPGWADGPAHAPHPLVFIEEVVSR